MTNSTIGNVEAGIVGRTDLGNFKLNYRFGVSLPTASGSDGMEGMLNLYTNIYGALADPANFSAALPDYLTIRTSASPEFELGPIFVRADLGTDILIRTGDVPEDSAEVMLRINAAVGVDLGGVQLAVETANSFLLTQSGVDPLSAVGVTAALPLDNVTVFGGVSLPVGEGALGDEQASTTIILNTGLRLNF
ncbi:MAG: hypothetical protein HOI23_21505 [Deltaproteobacteria bacterium]|nr:hypothetical protein [Deltaproteobacteria bacterium]MBT6431859.1 hypothetical protein [Deltaproteobacteria bacterium]MBT6491863.1 hypothetical protein [Deltaproteobacteria bacterium]